MKQMDHRLARKLYRYETISKYQKKAKLLGYQDVDTVVFSFLNTRLLLSILLFIFFSIVTDWNYIVALLITFFFAFVFTYYVFNYRLSKRARKLEKEAIAFFEVFTLSLESGKNLIQSFKLTTEHIHSGLSSEIANSVREVEYGKSFHDAFTDLRKRLPSDTVQNVILNLVEAYRSGGDIISTLRKQIDFIQNKRVMDLKTQINQIPIKISVVSVFLLIPLVLLLILAPVILQYFGS